MLASARGCSSRSNTVVPLRVFSSIGRIWPLKWPFSIALIARRWLSTENSSCCSREIFHFSAMFSAVMPMCTVSKGSVNAPTIMSTTLPSLMRWPQRSVGMM